MALLAGYIGYGTGNSPATFVELSGGSYARSALTYTGNPGAGTLACSAATAPATAGSYSAIAVFDAATGGNMTLFASMGVSMAFAAGAAIPAYSQAVTFYPSLYTELSAPGSLFPQGSDLGTLAGQALLAASALEISGAGTLIAGAGSIMIPACTGAPTDVPMTVNGFVPMRVDPINSKVWFYTGAAWKGVVIS